MSVRKSFRSSRNDNRLREIIFTFLTEYTSTCYLVLLIIVMISGCISRKGSIPNLLSSNLVALQNNKTPNFVPQSPQLMTLRSMHSCLKMRYHEAACSNARAFCAVVPSSGGDGGPADGMCFQLFSLDLYCFPM